MNERIKELAKQARLLTGWPVGEVEFQKFAELIVRECADVAYGTYWQDPEGVRGIYLKDAILENFGVKA